MAINQSDIRFSKILEDLERVKKSYVLQEIGDGIYVEMATGRYFKKDDDGNLTFYCRD